MKNLKHVLFGFALGAAALFTSQAVSQEEPVGPHDPRAHDPGEMMKRWQEARTPGEQHAELGKLIGDWTYEMTMDMGGQPMKSTGTSRIDWLIEGMWLEHRSMGSMMGMPFEQFAVTGYDNFRKHHVTAAVDNMNTHLLRMEGTRSPDGKIHYWGRMDEPMTGELGKMVRTTITHHSDDEWTMEIYDHAISPGEDAKVVSFHYRRKGTEAPDTGK